MAGTAEAARGTRSAPGTRARDLISLSGITAVGYHGVFEHEKRNGQPFVVDVVLHTDIRAAAASDDLADTTNYGELAEAVKTEVTSGPYDLIETLTERIAAVVLERFSVEAVDVTVHKPKAPIEVPFGDVSITIHRERA
ncbi:dihydroneopterin aldolase [Zafaria sp. Z1313]|uniref:dihydroneopterin aldolase n=1 Tax=Zafaria sp. Z1313 TaxID=3423202 RepID=UPI003D3030D1